MVPEIIYHSFHVTYKFGSYWPEFGRTDCGKPSSGQKNHRLWFDFLVLQVFRKLIPPWFPHSLGKHISQVGLCVTCTQSDCTFCNWLLSAILSNAMVILCQGWLWLRLVFTDGPIVTEDVRWTVDWESKHTKLVAKGLYHIYWILHYSELRPKGICFYQFMTLSEPYDYCFVIEQQYYSLRTSRLGVPSMVFIKTSVYWHTLTSRHWFSPGIASLAPQWNSAQSQYWKRSSFMAGLVNSNPISYLGATSGTHIC